MSEAEKNRGGGEGERAVPSIGPGTPAVGPKKRTQAVLLLLFGLVGMCLLCALGTFVMSLARVVKQRSTPTTAPNSSGRATEHDDDVPQDPYHTMYPQVMAAVESYNRVARQLQDANEKLERARSRQLSPQPEERKTQEEDKAKLEGEVPRLEAELAQEGFKIAQLRLPLQAKDLRRRATLADSRGAKEEAARLRALADETEAALNDKALAVQEDQAFQDKMNQEIQEQGQRAERAEHDASTKRREEQDTLADAAARGDRGAYTKLVESLREEMKNHESAQVRRSQAKVQMLVWEEQLKVRLVSLASTERMKDEIGNSVRHADHEDERAKEIYRDLVKQAATQAVERDKAKVMLRAWTEVLD